MSGSTIGGLAGSAQAGDRQAADVLFARAARLAYARALKATGDAEVAWDIAQDALVAAIEGLPRLREPEAFLGWLRTIVEHSTAAHQGRAAGKREDGLHAAEPLASPEPEPAESAERVELAAQVRRAMASLPPRNRLIVELFYFDDMSCREVAEFLKTSRDAVKMALHRSRQQMRKVMMTVGPESTEKTDDLTIHTIMSSGESKAISDAVIFRHDSRTARFYMQLYPKGDAAEAARALGMAAEDRDAELEWLGVRTLIARDGDLWRCTMPVANERDLEILRPWAEQVTAPVTAELERLHGELLEIAGQVPPGSARETVMAVGLFAEVARRPFGFLSYTDNLLGAALEASWTERGEFGACSAAAVSAKTGWPTEYVGGLHTGHWNADSPPHMRCDYVLGPKGTDRGEMSEFVRSLGETAGEWDSRHGLTALLMSLGFDPISVAGVADRAAEVALEVSDARALVEALQRLGAIRVSDGEIELAIPVVPEAIWQAFLEELEALGERIAGEITDAADDLRQRMLRCLFAECNFSDSVSLCIGYVQNLLSAEIHARGWVTFPERADFSWGIMFAY